jgi:hypothetical protein
VLVRAPALDPCRLASKVQAAVQQAARAEKALVAANAATSAAEVQREESTAALLACQAKLRDADQTAAALRAELAAKGGEVQAAVEAKLASEDAGACLRACSPG